MSSSSNTADCYRDIINLPRPRSQVYPPMSQAKRAAQFSPFAALSGHEEAIKEKARLTERKVELSDTKKAQLNAGLLLLKQHLKHQPTISMTYFVPDEQKSGGAYVTETGVVTKIAEYERLITFQQKTIPIDNIVSLEGKLFDQIRYFGS